jgi:protein SCO1
LLVSCKRAKFIALFSLLLLVAGCRRPAAPPAGQQKSFPVRGVIVSTDASRGEVLLNHEAIPGFMEAMEMPYRLKDPGVISELHPGDRITAALLVDQADGEYRNPRLDQIVIIAQARPDYKPAVQYHVPQPGDGVPDFQLLNQSNRHIHLDQFHGRIVLLTFIYTRCPLADFCPRMSHNFAEIDRQLSANPTLYRQTHLLSISFDPAYDTPAVLRRYGGISTGRFTKENFAHWDFAAPPAVELPRMEQFFDLGVTPGDNNTMNHSLSTVLIDKDGKVVAFYHGNDWDPAAVLAQMTESAAHS